MSRAQLLALGFSRSAISHRLAQGRLHQLHLGVYAVGHAVVASAGHRLAAVLACGDDGFASHLSAAGAWGIRPHSSGVQHVTVLPGNGSRSRSRLRVHRHRLAEDDTTLVDGLPATTLGRTLADLGDLLPAEHVRRAFVRAEQLRIIDMVDIDGALERCGRRRGPSILRGILRAYDPRWQATRSGLELRALDLVEEMAAPQPEVNTWLAGRWEADLLWREERLVVEIDGGGVHGTAGARARDAVRDRALRRLGLRVLHVSEEELDEPERVAKRLTRPLAARRGG